MTSPEAMMNSNSRPAPDLSAMLRGRDPLAPFRITLDVHSVFGLFASKCGVRSVARRR